MSITELLPKAHGRVAIVLSDGSCHTGRFREDILTESAMATFFHGDVRDMSLPIDAIVAVKPLDDEFQLAS